MVQDKDFSKLLTVVAKGGQDVDVCLTALPPWDPRSGQPKPKYEEREPFPARILDCPPAGVNLPPECGIVVDIFPRAISRDAIGAVREISMMRTSDGVT
jgi:hypothetical protein